MRLERLFPPPQDCTEVWWVFPRAVLSALFGGVALRAGLSYVHFCEAGSRLLEWAALLGVPLLVAGLVLFARRPWRGMLWAALVTVVVYALSGPYLAWAHGR
jgi:hypothetical protein